MDGSIINKFTTHFRKTLTDASRLANSLNHAKIEADHLLYSLMQQKGSIGAEILLKSGMKSTALNQYVRDQQNYLTTPIKTGPLPLSETTKKTITKAAAIASRNGHRYIGTEHLLGGLLQMKEESIVKLLDKNQVNFDVLEKQLQVFMRSTSKFPDLTRIFEQNIEEIDKEPPMEEEPGSGQNRPALDFFTTDLTNQDMQSKIDPVIGRKKEIDRLIHILCRRTKNNPVLIGDAGVGKTAIVEGLAKKIAEGKVPTILLDKKILCLDMSLLVAGTIYRGEFENRIKQVIEEIKADPNIILFIDELHTIVGAGNSSGPMDAANILKPALAKGEIRCIGATTLDEFRKHIESDPALERRFQQILVDEPSPEDTLNILKGLRPHYERYHRVRIGTDALNSAVELSSRYITEKFQPDKAIDLIDEAASGIKVAKQSQSVMSHIKNLEKKLIHLHRKKQQAVWQEKYQMALEYKREERQIRLKLDRLNKEYKTSTLKPLGQITKAEIVAVIARMTKIPLNELMMDEKERLLGLEKTLKKQIIGQDQALEQVAKAIRRSRAGLSNPGRPIGSFIFIGPSGVGKTELAKEIARTVYEDEKALLRFDMSEFSESFQSSKLIGAPAGYVGYKEGSKLTEQVRRRPYCVVLFDEIEKAHPDIFNLFLQILEDGHITDATGKMVNFKNTIVIMTSNVGLRALNSSATLGFTAKDPDQKKQAEADYEKTKELVLNELKNAFRPEFLNRVDHIIMFRPLGLGDLVKISERQLEELASRLNKQSIDLQSDRKAARLIAKISYAPDQGARSIRRNIENLIEAPLADGVLSGKFQEGSKVHISAEKDKVVLK